MTPKITFLGLTFAGSEATGNKNYAWWKLPGVLMLIKWMERNEYLRMSEVWKTVG